MAFINYKLTIAIPSYNRNEILKRNLSYLLSQLTPEVNIIIYDNCSDIPVSETLKDELESFDNLKVFRNIANIGLSGNLIRCFEYCSTEWLWLLSDDDTPIEKAIANIFKYIIKSPEVYFVNFKSDYVPQRDEDIHLVGENEFIDKSESIHNLFLMSVGLYNVNRVRPFLKFAYLYAYSLVPHFVVLIVSLKNSGKVILSKDLVISSQGRTQEENSGWSFIPVCLGLPTIFELPLNLTKKNNLKIANFIKNDFIRSPFFSLERVLQLFRIEEIRTLKHNFRQPYLRLNTKISVLWQFQYYICLLILNCPPLIRLFMYTFNFLRTKFKKPNNQISKDRFNRL